LNRGEPEDRNVTEPFSNFAPPHLEIFRRLLHVTRTVLTARRDDVAAASSAVGWYVCIVPHSWHHAVRCCQRVTQLLVACVTYHYSLPLAVCKLDFLFCDFNETRQSCRPSSSRVESHIILMPSCPVVPKLLKEK